MDKTNARYNLVFGRWFNKSSRNQVANYALAIIASQFLRYRSFAPFPQNNPTNLTICGDPRISRFSGDPTTPQKSHDFQGTPLHPKNLAIFGDPIDCGQQVRFLLQVKDLWVISEGYSNFALSKKSLLTPILVATKEV